MTKLNKADLLKKAEILLPVDTKEMLARLQIVSANNKSSGLDRVFNILHTAKPAKLKAFAKSDLGIKILDMASDLPSSTSLRAFYKKLNTVDLGIETVAKSLGLDCLSEADMIQLATQSTEQSLDLCKLVNKGHKCEAKTFGNWRVAINNRKDLNLYPVVADVKGFDRKAFLSMLAARQSNLEEVSLRKAVRNPWGLANAGFYVDKGWTWNVNAYAMIAEGVLPTKAFFKLITGKSLPVLPY